MDQHELKGNITSRINEAIDAGLSRHTIERTLQGLAQDVRDDRNVEEVFEFECSEHNCEEAFSKGFRKMDKRCDVCDDRLGLVGHSAVDNERRMKFTCPDHGTTRVFSVNLDDVTCSEHGAMKLVESSPA